MTTRRKKPCLHTHTASSMVERFVRCVDCGAVARWVPFVSRPKWPKTNNAGIRHPQVDAATRAKRTPPPPEALVGAVQDTLHEDKGPARAAKVTRRTAAESGEEEA